MVSRQSLEKLNKQHKWLMSSLYWIKKYCLQRKKVSDSQTVKRNNTAYSIYSAKKDSYLWTNDSYEPVLFIESKTYSINSSLIQEKNDSYKPAILFSEINT